MNILFISHLGDSLSAGPAWSVPARITAQCKIDNVYWVNISSTAINHQHWIDTGVYHDINELAKASLNELPQPFNRPDLVMFEGFYGGFKEMALAKECWKYNIPYIITPRGSLTHQAMHNKSRWKKEIAHLLFYDKFIKKALAVQYLTNKEFEDAKYRFNTKHLIIPNGFNVPKQTKITFASDKITGIFIGRIDVYHKGLDILLDAIENIQQDLRESKFTLDIYGPKRQDFDKVNRIITDKGIQDIVKMRGEILGEDKTKALLNADIFFLTSRFEGHPMGLIEALAYGLPCIITTGSNMRPEVEEFDAGWCSDVSYEGVRASLVNMLKERDTLPQKSNNAMRLAANYQWDKLAQILHDNVVTLLTNK